MLYFLQLLRALHMCFLALLKTSLIQRPTIITMDRSLMSTEAIDLIKYIEIPKCINKGLPLKMILQCLFEDIKHALPHTHGVSVTLMNEY